MGGAKDDWQVKRPPLTEKQRRAIEKATRERMDQEIRDSIKESEARERLRQAREAAEQDRINANAPAWEKKRQDGINALTILATQLRIRKNKWMNSAIDLSSAYESACTNFGKLIGEATATNQLFWGMAFTALASVGVGVINVLATKYAEKWARVDAQRLFVAAAEDAVQTGFSGTLSVMAPLIASKYDATEIPSPLAYRGELEKLLNDMETDVLQWIVDLQQILRKAELYQLEHVSVVDLDSSIEKYLSDQDSQLDKLPFRLAGTKAELSKELEKLILGAWTVSFMERELGRSSFAVRRRLPDKVIDALVAHGIVSDSGHYSDADVLRVADWGPNTSRLFRATIMKIKAYTPRKFG